MLTENVLRVASVVLFFASVAALRVDWKGAESSHNEAVRRMSELVAAYREARHDDGDLVGGSWRAAISSLHYSNNVDRGDPNSPVRFAESQLPPCERGQQAHRQEARLSQALGGLGCANQSRKRRR